MDRCACAVLSNYLLLSLSLPASLSLTLFLSLSLPKPSCLSLSLALSLSFAPYTLNPKSWTPHQEENKGAELGALSALTGALLKTDAIDKVFVFNTAASTLNTQH